MVNVTDYGYGKTNFCNKCALKKIGHVSIFCTFSIVPSPIRCTTLSNVRNLTGPENCGVIGVNDWSSCEEWCLSKVEVCEIITKTITNKARPRARAGALFIFKKPYHYIPNLGF